MEDIWIRTLVMVMLFVAIVLVVERIAGSLIVSRAATKSRNSRLAAIARGVSRVETMSMLRRDMSPLPQGLPAFLTRRAVKLEKMLIMAGTAVPTQRLLWILLVSPLALFFVLTMIVLTLNLSLGIGRFLLLSSVAIAIGTVVPVALLQFRANRRRRKFQEQFPVALDVFVRGLRAGHPVASALDLLTTEMPDPIGSEFGLVVDEVAYGANLTDALSAMAERWDLDDIRMFVVSLAVQSETGGNLAEILDNLSRVIRERASMMMKVRALSSEGRMTAWMLSVLPVATFVLLFLINPQFYLDVAGDRLFAPGFGLLILMYSIGVWMIRKMIDLKV